MRSNIGSILTKRAHMNPDNEALFDVSAGRRFNYAELNDRTNQVVNALAPSVKKGDRVALLMMNSHEFISAFFAIAKLGAVVVPLNWRLVPDELEFILKDSGSTVLFYGEEFLPSVGELHSRGDKTDINLWIHTGSDATKPPFAKGFNELVDPAPSTEPEITAFDDDMLYIMYTSGTTGLPKGVMHTHTTQMEALVTLNATSDFCIGDRYLNPMPLFHVGALTPAIVGAYRGLAHILMRAFDPVKVWELVRDEKINNALLVPAMLGACRMVYDPATHDHSTLRWFLSGAAPVPKALIEAYAEMGIEIHQVYGLTETCGPACLTTPEDALRKAGSTGKAFFHTDVKLVRPDGSECDVDEPGEVLIRGGHIMTGYWNRPDATAEAIRDGILAVSGNLDLTMFGPGFDLFEPNSNYVKVYTPKKTFGPAEWRRMIYQSKPRMQLDDIFGNFDCPDAGQIAPKRSRSITPLQALALLNSPFMAQQSDLLAKRLEREAPDSSSRIHRLFQLINGRDPDNDEKEGALDLVNHSGLPSLCRAMLNSSEWLFIR